MKQRGDFLVLQELFGRWAYYSEEHIFERAVDITPIAEYNYQEECGYKQLLELFKKVVENTGEIPIVINADDLVEHTAAVIQAYCSRIGIPFVL